MTNYLRSTPAELSPGLAIESPLEPDWLLSLATVPLITTLLAGRLLADWAQQVGWASEEIFRGERLPVLPIALLSEPLPEDES
ncbi:hypothetical protein [Vasconcelosia minhoensis]|uniref:hypothetical protein n=1 Tax=Vasconcelosia minhoensis TaxID=3366354 RepID=UPI001D14F85F|nr:hypothetical protein [Romeria gracilis]